MPFTCVCDRQQDVSILRCAGSIIVGDDSDYFHRAMLDAAQGAIGIVVDLSRVTYVDSSGLGSLIRACNVQAVQHRPVAYLKPSKRVLELIQMTRVDKVLKIFEDEGAAVAHAEGTRAAPRVQTTKGAAILCIEPDPPTQACIVALLEGAGFNVTGVRSAYDARMLGSGAALVVLGPGLTPGAQAAARAGLSSARKFVVVAPDFAGAESEAEIRQLLAQVAEELAR